MKELDYLLLNFKTKLQWKDMDLRLLMVGNILLDKLRN